MQFVTLGNQIRIRSTERVTQDPREHLRLTRAQIASVTAGNALEFYDFVTYTFFATQIGRALFPGTASQSLLLSLATFGVGFLTRPLGGLIIGRMADRRGRKPAMILSFAIMGVAMTGLALTPSFAAAGMAAPVFALFFRLLQGFALGGEVGPNIAYLMEAAPPNRRGLFISLNFASADFAVLVAGLVGFGLSSALTAAQLESWGWRAAFLLGAAIVPIAFWTKSLIDIAICRAVGEALFLPGLFHAVHRMADISFKQYIKTLYRPFLASTLMAISVVGTNLALPISGNTRLATDIGLGAAVFLGSAWILWRMAGSPHSPEADVFGRFAKVFQVSSAHTR